MTKLREYRIEAGNSNDGAVGFVAYFKARGRQHALRILQRELGRDEHKIQIEGGEVLVYFNTAALTVKDVGLAG